MAAADLGIVRADFRFGHLRRIRFGYSYSRNRWRSGGQCEHKGRNYGHGINLSQTAACCCLNSTNCFAGRSVRRCYRAPVKRFIGILHRRYAELRFDMGTLTFGQRGAA